MGLKELLGEELYNQVAAALKGKGPDGKDLEIGVINDGSYFPKSKFDAVNEENKALKEQLKQRDSDIAELKKSSGANEELKNQLSELKKKYKTDTESLNQKLSQLQFDNALDVALMGAKAKNVKAVKALLDIEKIKFDNGQLLGLNEQLEAIKKDNDYLFDTQPPYKPVSGSSGTSSLTIEQQFEKALKGEI